MEKILLDTDIGSDIDDAVCLAYLLAHPDCDLMGITTVTGEPIKRAMMASVLCRLAGKDIPIFPGGADPLLVKQRQPLAQQAAEIKKWDHQKDFPTGQAVSFLRDTIRKNPGEITLLTIGPLTNIALLFALDPEIPTMLKQLVMMCGSFTPKARSKWPTEWNALLDPHATAMVYQHQCPIHRSVGLDVTFQVQMPVQEVHQRFQARLLQPVLDFAKVWFQEQQQITFHDPLAAVSIFDDSTLTYQKGNVAVELRAPDKLGATVLSTTDAVMPHEIATAVNSNRFFEKYFSVFE
ncbi:nucleoside hydrolase [bacterium]|nr:nucleoside hydrolase [bacterium]